jgi:hypothetical protein
LFDDASNGIRRLFRVKTPGEFDVADGRAPATAGED